MCSELARSQSKCLLDLTDVGLCGRGPREPGGSVVREVPLYLEACWFELMKDKYFVTNE